MIGRRRSDTDELCFKSHQMNTQQGIKTHGQTGKEHSMTKIKNLADKNECFSETSCEHPTSKIKDRDLPLPLLMFVFVKRSGEIKTRGFTNGSLQREYADKNEHSYPKPDHYSLKHVCDTIAK